MRAYVATGMLGTFAFDETGKLLDYILFRKDAEFIASRLERVRKGEIVEEEEELLKRLRKKGFKEVVWAKEVQPKGIDMICLYKKDNVAEETLSYSYRKYAIQFNWVTTQAEINEVLTKVNVLLTKTQLKIAKKDKILMMATGALDEVEKDLNVFTEHLREWYGLYFPEAARHFESNEKLVAFVAESTTREAAEGGLAELAKRSAGMPFGEDDLAEVQAFAKSIHDLYFREEKLRKYVEDSAKAIIPNVSAVAGPLLAARMLSLAGGLDKISSMPSSTVQLLGAEKALFRHLKGMGKAPKYGILFSHPYIQAAPKHLKGKMARLVAAKISIAARIDKFSKEDRGAEMKRQLDEQVAKLK